MSQFFDILTYPPGNLVYHIVLAFIVMTGIEIILYQIKERGTSAIKRLLLAFSVILMGQLFLFLSSGLAWQGVGDPHTFLPPLDRAVVALMTLWVVWVWAFPEKNRNADVLLVIFNGLLILLFAITLISWTGSSAGNTFNATWQDKSWLIFSLLIIILGMIALFAKKPSFWGIGFGFLLLTLAGNLAHFLFAENSGNFSGAIRFAQLCSFPLLMVLTRKNEYNPASPPENAISPKSIFEAEISPEIKPRKFGADPLTASAWLEVVTEKNNAEKCFKLTRALAQTMNADICLFFVHSKVEPGLVSSCGYDLIRNRKINELSFSEDQLPNIVQFFINCKPTILEKNQSNDPVTDFFTLEKSLDIDPAESMFVYPLKDIQENSGGFVFISPYSNTLWTEDDISYFDTLQKQIQLIMQQIQTNDDESGLEKILSPYKITIENLRDENRQLNVEIQAIKEVLTDQINLDKDLNSNFEAEFKQRIHYLESENTALRQKFSQTKTTSPENEKELEQIETELRLTLEEVARLQNTLAESNIKILTLEQRLNEPGLVDSEENEVIASIVQELRQPMSSILGYTDLLIGESVGILGALQRKFLERIKASNERMRGLLDDLLHVTSYRNEPIALMPQFVDLNSILDQAISDTSAQLKEKSIILEVDLPDQLPQIQVDRDAIQQVLIHLLQNAGSASPYDGTIRLSVHQQKNNQNGDYILIQVRDSGSGIPAEDIQKVFTRRYRADHALIQGVGDTGIGLSITKTLIEAHGGRIWVESKIGDGTTFSILLPSTPETSKKPLPQNEIIA
jgi:signal transduction histidine kinase